MSLYTNIEHPFPTVNPLSVSAPLPVYIVDIEYYSSLDDSIFYYYLLLLLHY